MQVMAFADIHGFTPAFGRLAAELAAADLILLAGDLTNFGHAPAAREFFAALQRHLDRVLAVTGNCDYPDVAPVCAEAGVLLNRTHRAFGGVVVLGLEASLPCPAKTPCEFTERQLADLLAEAAAGAPVGPPWVLMAHQPPLQTNADVCYGGEHVGSQSVRQFIETHRPRLCVCGHIHEGRSVDQLGETVVVNVGSLRNGHYGTFTLDPTSGAVSAVTLRTLTAPH